MFHGVTGLVFDRGTVEGADHCAAVCCCKKQFVAFVNGPGGGLVVAGAFQDLPYDLIQEWGFRRWPFRELAALPQERIIHAVSGLDRSTVVGTTTKSLFTVDPDAGRIEVQAELPCSGRIAVGSKGGIFGRDGTGHLWRYEVASRKLQRRAVELPAGDWDGVQLTWARGATNGRLYTADARGRLFCLDEDRGFSPLLGQTLLAPVGPMAVTHDGRVFGFCGADLAKMFCYDQRTRRVTDLGVAVSVLERRRYGYVFGDAVTGRDGQIFFGEDDDLGHLWLYFPRIQGDQAQ
jgi:hypothetical protein